MLELKKDFLCNKRLIGNNKKKCHCEKKSLFNTKKKVRNKIQENTPKLQTKFFDLATKIQILKFSATNSRKNVPIFLQTCF